MSTVHNKYYSWKHLASLNPIFPLPDFDVHERLYKNEGKKNDFTRQRVKLNT